MAKLPHETFYIGTNDVVKNLLGAMKTISDGKEQEIYDTTKLCRITEKRNDYEYTVTNQQLTFVAQALNGERYAVGESVYVMIPKEGKRIILGREIYSGEEDEYSAITNWRDKVVPIASVSVQGQEGVGSIWYGGEKSFGRLTNISSSVKEYCGDEKDEQQVWKGTLNKNVIFGLIGNFTNTSSGMSGRIYLFASGEDDSQERTNNLDPKTIFLEKITSNDDFNPALSTRQIYLTEGTYTYKKDILKRFFFPNFTIFPKDQEFGIIGYKIPEFASELCTCDFFTKNIFPISPGGSVLDPIIYYSINFFYKDDNGVVHNCHSIEDFPTDRYDNPMVYWWKGNNLMTGKDNLTAFEKLKDAYLTEVWLVYKDLRRKEQYEHAKTYENKKDEYVRLYIDDIKKHFTLQEISRMTSAQLYDAYLEYLERNITVVNAFQLTYDSTKEEEYDIVEVKNNG